jgi:hypothetical protein
MRRPKQPGQRVITLAMRAAGVDHDPHMPAIDQRLAFNIDYLRYGLVTSSREPVTMEHADCRAHGCHYERRGFNRCPDGECTETYRPALPLRYSTDMDSWYCTGCDARLALPPAPVTCSSARITHAAAGDGNCTLPCEEGFVPPGKCICISPSDALAPVDKS